MEMVSFISLHGLTILFCACELWSYHISRRIQSRGNFVLRSVAEDFGRQEYWQEFYKSSSSEGFSWYAEWRELEPFIGEWAEKDFDILIPGIGSDTLVRDMYDSGYHSICAFDYAKESIEFCRNMLKERPVDLIVADATNLDFKSSSFDMILDKGTFDAIFISGKTELEKREKLFEAVAELQRLQHLHNTISFALVVA